MQANRFIAIMDNFGRIQEVNNDLMGSAGTLAEGYGTVMDSVGAKADRAKASFEGMWIGAINSDVIGVFYDLSFVFTELIRVIGLVPLALSVVVIGLQALHAQSVLNEGSFAKWTGTMKNWTRGIMESGREIKNAEGGIIGWVSAIGKSITANKEANTASMMNNMTTKASSIIHDEHTGKVLIGATAQGIFKKALDFAKGGIVNMGVALLGTIPLLVKFAVLTGGLTILTGVISSVVGKVVELGKGMFGLGSSTDVATDSINELNQAISQSNQSVKTLKDLSREHDSLVAKMGGSRDITKLSAEEQERYNGIMQQIEQIAPNYITYVGEQNTAMLTYGRTLDDIIEKEEKLIELNKQEMIEEASKGDLELGIKRNKLANKQEQLDNALERLDSSGSLERTNKMRGIHGDQADIENENAIKNIGNLKQEIQELGDELDLASAKQQSALSILMEDLDGMYGVSDEMIGVAKEQIQEILNTEGWDAAESSISDFKIILEESKDMLGETGVEFDYTKHASDEMQEAFTRVGMDDAGIILFLTDLAIKLGLAKEGIDGVTGSTGYDVDEINAVRDKAEEISTMQQTLAEGGKLTLEQLIELIEGHEDIADYIAETGDVTLEHGERLRDIYGDIQETAQDMFDEFKKNNDDEIKALQEKAKGYENGMKWLEKIGKKGSDAYKSLQDNLVRTNTDIDNQNQKLEESEKRLQAIENATMGDLGEMSLGVAVQGYDEAQSQIDSYREIIQKIDEKGKLSAETNRQIISQHHELTHVIGEEAEMRDFIQEKIKETEQVAINYYKQILMESDHYYKNMLETNSALFFGLSLMYGINFNNFKNMSEAMIAIADITGKEIASALSMTVRGNVSTSSTASQFSAEIMAIDKEISDIEDALASGSAGRIMAYGGQIQAEAKIKSLEVDRKYHVDALESRRNEDYATELITEFMQEATSGGGDPGKLSGGGAPAYKATNPKGVAGSGGRAGGTSSVAEARKLDNMEITDSINTYRRWEQAIIRVTDALARHQIVLSRATGEDRINLIDKENSLLKEQQKLVAGMAEEQRREQAVLRDFLSKWGVDLDSATGGASDYERLMMNRQRMIDQKTADINAITTETDGRQKLVDERDDLKSGIDSLTKAWERSVELLNLTESNSTQWWELQSKILDNQIAKIQEGMKKFDDMLGFLDDKIALAGKIREDRPLELRNELELLEEIIDVTRKSRSSLNHMMAESNSKLSKMESQLLSFGETRNAQYQAIANRMIFEKEYNKVIMDAFIDQTLNLNKAMEDAVDKRIEGLNRERDAMLENIDTILEMEYAYTFRGLEVDSRDLQHKIDLLNDVFLDDPKVRLDTDDVQAELDSIEDRYNSLKDLYDDFKGQVENLPKEDEDVIKSLEDAISSLDDESNLDGIVADFGLIGATLEEAKESLTEMLESERLSKEINEEKQEALEGIMEAQSKLIIQNEEEAKKLREELEDMAFEYKEIEASLQNKINLKEDELKQLQEQARREEDVRRKMEKQLELLRALDDTRHSYITGTGEEVFTYDISAVNKLRKELDKLERDDRQKKEEDDLKALIDEMKEELKRTKEINALSIEVGYLQVTALEQNTEALRDSLEDSKEAYEDVFEGLSDNLIDEWKKAMEGIVGTHSAITDDYINRIVVQAVEDKFRHQGKGESFYKQESVAVKKGESVSDLATKFQMTEKVLRNLNKWLGSSKTVGSDGSINIIREAWDHEEFDTGGYTGNWGSSGKMAMLHQKELVLNDVDTKNLLKTIDITRSMTSGLKQKGSDWSKRESINNGVTQEVNIANLNLPSVKDGKSFVNEMHGFLRGGQNKLI